jgi:hypothetical protein
MNMSTTDKKERGWKRKLIHELSDYWFIVLYLTIFFSVFTNYQRLILAHYNIIYTDYGISVIKALVLGKVVLIAESLHVGRRFENKPLIFSVIYNSIVFTVCVLLFNTAEVIVDGFIHKMNAEQAVAELVSHYNYELFARGMVVFFAFIPFFAVRELGLILGPGMMRKLFFQKRSAWRLTLDEQCSRGTVGGPADK